ncbi:MAG: putative manganese-dependent inorganic diphosphatase [Deltaproteobacteria bacterium]|nr:putative manganese-dependent inorganic diphosphatase [Deltaproteobacteria bacterium]
MKKESIYVIGHKNPDTDSICSAIGLAELKKAEGAANVLPARAGDINPQTAFILNYFNVEPPRYLPNVYPKAADIMSTEVVRVSGATPLLEVMELMRGEKIRFIPVVDSLGKPQGALTLMDLAKRYILTEADGLREVTATLANIVGVLKAEIVLDYLGDSERTFSVYVGAMGVDSFLNILGDEDHPACAVIVGDRADIQMTSAERGVGLLIVTGGFNINKAVLHEARKNNVSVIISPFDSVTTALLVRLSTPALKVSANTLETAKLDELASDLKLRLSSATGIVVLDGDGVMKGVVTKTNLLQPPATSLILVDHNELSQAVDGADMVNILEVIDHHRIGNFHTSQPIPFICEPVGSTSTLVSELFRRKGIPLKKETAGLLLGGVLSDTVILKSPTTTHRDREIVGWLEGISGLDHKTFGAEIFGATSSLKNRGAEAAVGGDFKVFEAKGRKFGIGQVETIGFEEFHEEKLKLREELVKVMEKKDLKLSAVLITDIVLGTSMLLAIGEREIMYKLDYPKLDENVYELKNVISRKKQVVPHILSLFNAVY